MARSTARGVWLRAARSGVWALVAACVLAQAGTVTFASESATSPIEASVIALSDDSGVGVTTTFMIVDPYRLPAPDGVVVSAGVESIGVSWLPVQRADVVGYIVYRSLTRDGVYSEVATLGAGETAFTDVEIVPRVTFYYRVAAVRDDGDVGARSAPRGAVVHTEIVRLWGQTRIETAVQVSRHAFGRADTVIIATSADFADALSASGLAGSYDAPLLLTQPDRLSSAVLEEIRGLGARHALVVGGPAAVSENVIASLRAAGLAVERFGGLDRYETALLIAAQIDRHERAMGRPLSTTLFLARGDIYPDALSVASFAYRLRAPIILTRPERLPLRALQFLIERRSPHLVIAGGVSAVSSRIQLEASRAGSSVTVRAGGQDRFETNALLIEHGVSQGWGRWNVMGFATGLNFPDALTGGVATGRMGGVLMLAGSSRLSAHGEEQVIRQRSQMFRVRLFGGTNSLGASIETQLKAAFQ